LGHPSNMHCSSLITLSFTKMAYSPKSVCPTV
jgi:hypothetical protein